MNITFLIGNGFDLNLGLKTRYSDFIKEYTKYHSSDSDIITQFKKDISKEAETWSDAEIALGQYTKNFSCTKKGLEEFFDCLEDFCNNLAEYLSAEEKRINLSEMRDLPIIFERAIENITKGFGDDEEDKIFGYRDWIENTTYNFISFNYTRTLDECVKLSVKSPETTLEYDDENSEISSDSQVGEVLHVHGYTDRDLVLGVNDITQITNEELFNQGPIEYLYQLIKIETNKMNGENIDERVHEVIKESDIIYIYGMSLGETDKMWWERICEVMKESDTVLIIHQFDAPKHTLLKARAIVNRKNKKNHFVDFSSLPENTKDIIKDQIFITGENVFEELTGIEYTEEGIKVLTS